MWTCAFGCKCKVYFGVLKSCSAFLFPSYPPGRVHWLVDAGVDFHECKQIKVAVLHAISPKQFEPNVHPLRPRRTLNLAQKWA